MKYDKFIHDSGKVTLNGDIKITLNNAVLKGYWGSSVKYCVNRHWHKMYLDFGLWHFIWIVGLFICANEFCNHYKGAT